MAEDYARASQTAVLTPFAGNPAARASQLAVLAPYGPPATKKAKASQIATLVPMAGEVAETIPRAIQIVVQVVYTRAVPEDHRLRAFTFKWDGHAFYGITLGEQGTYVRDVVTGQWSRFQTDPFTAWNFQYPIQWKDRTVGFDIVNPTMYFLDSDSALDDSFRPIRRKATGLVEHRGFSRLPQYSLTFLASAGEPEDDGNQITMRFTDDGGNTWSNPRTLTVEPGAFLQRLSYRSLGSIRQPGRFFEIEDIGATQRLDAIEAEIEGLDE